MVPEYDDLESPFVAFENEFHIVKKKIKEGENHFVASDDLNYKQLLILHKQCEEYVDKAFGNSSKFGISLKVNQSLLRIRQQLHRIKVLLSSLVINSEIDKKNNKMNITRQEVDAQNAVLKVNIAPADYQGKVKASLEKYRKTAKIPGFRPGNIPMALIQKQVGKSVLAEELNKLTNDALYRYISEEKLEILGNPIPKEDEGMTGSFDQPENFEFSFEIGYSPAFELPINAKSKFDYATVKIDKELINKQVEDLRRRYGKLVSSDSVGDKDMVMGKFEEKDADGSVKADGISHSSTISMEFLENKAGVKALKGKKINEVIDRIKLTSIYY